MNAMKWIWLLAIFAFGAVEIATTSLVSMWFAVGGIAALIAELLGAGVTAQLMIFAVVSAAALVLALPLVKRAGARGRKTATNLDSVIGKTVRVTEAIDNTIPSGTVYVDGKTWTARSASGDILPQGTQVTVESIEGVKLFVRKIEDSAEVVT